MNEVETIDQELAKKLSQMRAERDRLWEVLRWYERHVSDCNRKGKEGDAARNALAKDMGKRARAALQEDRT